MNPVIIDASAGVELVADTVRGGALRRLLPADAVPWVPELFYVECGAVLRRWDLNRVLTKQIARAVEELMAWPLRVTQVRGLFARRVAAAGKRHVRRRGLRSSCRTPRPAPALGRSAAGQRTRPESSGLALAVGRITSQLS